jgi:hypothetical protein
MLQQEIKNLKNKCSRIKSQGKQRVLKFHEVVNSHKKSITVEEIFVNISKWMLETSYTLNLRQLFKITHELKRYL